MQFYQLNTSALRFSEVWRMYQPWYFAVVVALFKMFRISMSPTATFGLPAYFRDVVCAEGEIAPACKAKLASNCSDLLLNGFREPRYYRLPHTPGREIDSHGGVFLRHESGKSTAAIIYTRTRDGNESIVFYVASFLGGGRHLVTTSNSRFFTPPVGCQMRHVSAESISALVRDHEQWIADKKTVRLTSYSDVEREYDAKEDLQLQDWLERGLYVRVDNHG